MFYFAEAVAAVPSFDVLGKGLMVGLGLIGPTIGVGMFGGNYLKAVGRNPEAAKFFSQAMIFAAMVEVFGFIAFAATFILK